MSQKKLANRPYRFSTTFIRLLAVLLSITLILCFLLTVVFYYSMADSVSQKELDLHKNLLSSQIRATDDILNTTQQSILHLTMSESLVQVCFLEEYNRAICNKVLLDLASLSSHSDVLESLVLYVFKLNMIFDDTYLSAPFSESRHQSLVTGFLNGVENSNQVVYGTQTSTLYYQDGDVIVARNYPLSNVHSLSSATLFCTLNSKALFGHLDSDNIRVYDTFGDPLYPAESSAPERDA